MANFSVAPTLSLEVPASGSSEQLALFDDVEVGNPKEEKAEATRRAESLMSGIGEVATRFGEDGAEVDAEKPESAADRLEKMLDSMGTTISTAMNTAVGHDLQARDARVVGEPLIEAKNLAKTAVEIEDYESGKVTLESLSEEARAELNAGRTSSEVMDRAESLTSSALEVKKKQQEALQFDAKLSAARDAYVEALTRRKGILPSERAKRKEELAKLEEAYNQAFVERIADIMALNPGHRKAPYVVDVMQALQGEGELTFEGLAGNHLHVLADSLVREQLNKAKAIEAKSSVGAKRVLKAFKESRALRVAVGGAIWGLSLAAANKGLLPAPLEGVGDAFSKVLPLVAGYMTSREVASGVDEGIKGFRARKEMKAGVEALSESERLGEAALRTIYSGIEYEDVTNRRVGESAEETREVFGDINHQFELLEQSGSRGGKPYSAEEIMPIVSELYLERKDQIDAILESANPQEAFKKLCAEIIAKDSEKLTKEVHTSRKKNAIFRALSVASSVFVGQFVSMASDIQGASTKPSSWVEKA